jgi:hypothetical protein
VLVAQRMPFVLVLVVVAVSSSRSFTVEVSLRWLRIA